MSDGAAYPAYPQDRSCPYHPPAAYQPLREQRPLARVRFYDGSTVWAVTGHGEARRLLADPRLSSDSRHPSFPVPTARFEKFRNVVTPLLGVDNPQHHHQRRMLIPSFSVRRITALRQPIQAIVDRQLDAVLRQGPPADLVSSYALPIPSRVICALLGIPYEDHAYFEENSRIMLRGSTAGEAATARSNLESYLADLIARKQSRQAHRSRTVRAATSRTTESHECSASGAVSSPLSPTGHIDGLLDQLLVEHVTADRDTSGARDPAVDAIDTDELVPLAMVLLVAGHETTANLISLGTYTLLEHPDRLAALYAAPARYPAAVEELLRFLTVVDGIYRVAVEDIDVAGYTIRAGDPVVLASSLINRDPAVYSSPDALDLGRPARHHLAFGYGIHQCLGKNLARAEAEIALRSLFTRIPGLRLAVPPDEIPFKPGDSFQGAVELPVAW
nr:cytochrome P450 [Streptomyces monomycini]